MKTLFKSQELWDLVKNGYLDLNDKVGGLKEYQKWTLRHYSFFNK